MDNLDFDRAFSIWIEALDASYKRLRAIHADKLFSNDGSALYEDALREFNWIQSQIFGFKNLWAITTGNYVKDLRSETKE